MATSEVDALFKEIEQSKKKTESNVDLLRAIMEEFDIRVAEVEDQISKVVLGIETFCSDIVFWPILTKIHLKIQIFSPK